MPQGPAELQDRWEHDGNAIEWLEEEGFTFTRGGLIVAPSHASPNANNQSAIDYLCLEWDYAFDGWK